MCARLFDGTFENFRALWEFASYIDVGRARIKGITRNQNSFEQLVRIFVNDVAILESARLGFIRVANQIDRPFFVRLDKAPFQSAGESGPAAAAQARVFDFVDNVSARQR